MDDRNKVVVRQTSYIVVLNRVGADLDDALFTKPVNRMVDIRRFMDTTSCVIRSHLVPTAMN